MSTSEKIQRVIIGFVRREEVRKPIPETGWQKFWRERRGKPAPVTITHRLIPLPIMVSAVLEDKGPYWTLWMTMAESEPIREASCIGLKRLCLPLERGVILNVPKSLLTIVEDAAPSAPCGTGSN